jgi:hypothetical protein
MNPSAFNITGPTNTSRRWIELPRDAGLGAAAWVVSAQGRMRLRLQLPNLKGG